MAAQNNTIDVLYGIITSLRAPDGCPWDRKQTPDSLKKYIQEEAHELLEAIDHQDAAHICEELGDVLFQLLFVTNFYAERDAFTLDDVVTGITGKMIRRHPHVFGDDSQERCEQELRKRWDKIKAAEQQEKAAPQDLLDGVPKSLPALRRAQKISERAARQGFEWPTLATAIDKLDEEGDELRRALADDDKQQISEELGDLLFMLVNISRLTGIAAEEALQRSTEKFIGRFKKVGEALRESGRDFSQSTSAELLELWNAAKSR